MLRFILSFLTGFGIVYYLLNRKENSESKNEKNNLKFPPEPEILEDTNKLMNILKNFNKMKEKV